MRRTNKKGFTIVELVIVIAVIAILAAVLIPTFASLVEKANLSADEQAVRQMNTALTVYTAEHGKPANVSEVKRALDANDINIESMTPVTQGYAFYWNPEKNEIVLVGEGKGTAENSWSLLTTAGYGQKPTTPVTNFATLQEAVNGSSVATPVLITLDDDMTIKQADGECAHIQITNGQSVILDLNGKVLENENSLSPGYVPVLDIKEGGTLVVKNGTLKGQMAISALLGSNVSLENVTIDCTGNAIFAYGLTDVSIVDCKIKTSGDFGITSNSSAPENNGCRFYIHNTEITSNHTGIFIGTYSEIVIDNCPKIEGQWFGAFFRGNNVTIKNSTIYNNKTNADTDTDPYQANGVSGPAADVVFASGDGQPNSRYAATGTYICENVTIGQNGENPQVFVHQPGTGKVTVSGVTVTHECHKAFGETCDRTHSD